MVCLHQAGGSNAQKLSSSRCQRVGSTRYMAPLSDRDSVFTINRTNPRVFSSKLQLP